MTAQPSTLQLWSGRILTGLTALIFLLSAAMKLTGSPYLADGFEHLGWP